MKIKINLSLTKTKYNYLVMDYFFSQEQYDYVYKFLNLEKIKNTNVIRFKNKITKIWFHETYVNYYCLDEIHCHSKKGYKWLKNNWGKGIFKIAIYYSDKQELKTIVNRLINVKLIRNEKYEN